VLPLDDRSLVQLLCSRPPVGMMARDRLVFRPGQGHIPISSLITGTDRSMLVTATFRLREHGEDGVLLSSGDSRGGYVLYVLNDHLHFEHVQLGDRTVLVADTRLPTGSFEAGFLLHRQTGHSASIVLRHNQRKVGATHIPTTGMHLSFWGLDVGTDTADRVSTAYPPDFSYHWRSFGVLTIDFLDDLLVKDVALVMESTE
jgi:hypothetical protein